MDKRLILIFLVVCSLITLPLSGQAQAQARIGNFIFIFDGSTSMWKKVNGEYKLVIAKDAMKGVVDHLPDHVNTALMSYGHRVERDCSDVEALVDMQPLDRKLLKEKIQNISPKGRTPITFALQQALELLPGGSSATATSIVLLTDGIENCEGDPCSIVREAKNRGLNFQLDIIGFGVPEAESADLQCSAEAGGGSYLAAVDADELVSALDKATNTTRIVAASAVATGNRSNDTAAGRMNGKTVSIPVTAAAPAADSRAQTEMAASESAADTPSATITGADDSPAKEPDTRITRQMMPSAEKAQDSVMAVDSTATPTQTTAMAEPQSTEKSSEKSADGSSGDTRQSAESSAAEPEDQPAQKKPAQQMDETQAPVTTLAALNMSETGAGGDIALEAPAEVDAGKAFDVRWIGAADDWDYITTVEANASEGSYTQYTYTKDGNPLTLQAPLVPGDYEIRYVEGATQNTLTRLPLTVR